MSSEKINELSGWFSTYGLLTAERILERFNIKLEHQELANAIKDPLNLYYQLLRIPLKNVFNGIILAQAEDYRNYAQKIFVDYLISGVGVENEDSPGASTREALEAERVELVRLGEMFEQQEYIQQQLIAESQATLINLCRSLPIASKSIHDSKRQEIEDAMIPYVEQTEDMNIILRDFRRKFYDHIIRGTELLGLLSDYRPDMEKQLLNRALLDFDSAIGE